MPAVPSRSDSDPTTRSEEDEFHSVDSPLIVS
jgi:hypothetical protein